ncbi:hypothetical protein KAFR_0F02130 [Kazachstania africana CBS 2517]|uniref:Deacetylase sirtuin-type domain-containing protein n=1 Tax=Kazachstania africana (strain ATCC 22294 / BCRC 22015 / CBS 2517 / CECT 1963 / NBRC 1671 / NRRL Y-8276) TaxID=1071382 RepID=H2AWR0_KAZAF|nr:hypothetical protein KAFR_0F02130 [Kazachstania africana CBS 2517]CCF58810.1 hypothetical protein KAFR_0F02130 [Kazachstania africana CBS 2517]
MVTLSLGTTTFADQQRQKQQETREYGRKAIPLFHTGDDDDDDDNNDNDDDDDSVIHKDKKLKTTNDGNSIKFLSTVKPTDKNRDEKEIIKLENMPAEVDISRYNNSTTNKSLKPIEPKNPILILKNKLNNKYLLPDITREDTLNARMCLKYYGIRQFLDKYLPDELNSLYLYFLIKLLGFELKDTILLKAISMNVQQNSTEINVSDLSSTQIDDPLDKRQTVQLIKDLQKAFNKILATRIRLLSFNRIEDLVTKLHSASNIIVLTGAGVSTSLGIPDFRSSEGFYSQIKYLGLDDPQEVFSYDHFMRDPSIFYSIAKMVLPPENMYSPLHSFIKMLHDKGKLLRNYTQNIDNLESYAGIPPERLIQCHGSFATASCVTCHFQLPGEKIFKKIRNVEVPLCPYCYDRRKEYFPTNEPNATNISNVPRSYGVIKPDITFFGEALPSKFHKSIRHDLTQCDLLICIGTSLKVAPVSEIVNMLPAHVPQVLINRDPVKHTDFDLSLLGYCDDIASAITQKCGWDIPHEKWEKELKTKKFEYVGNERGVYTFEHK